MAEKKKDMDVTLISQLDTKKPVYRITGRVPRIETGIDKLHNLIREKGRISMSEAAENLGVSENTVREWGEILEEHKMVELHYPVMGKPSLGMIRPKLPKVKKKEEKKPGKPRIPFARRFKKKVILIYIEIIVLGELLIYIFLVNRYLAMNFVPTIRFHFDGFVAYLLNLPGLLASGNPSRLFYQPMYLAFLVILLIIIILIIALAIKSRKPRLYIREKPGKKKKEEKPEKEKPEKKKKEKEAGERKEDVGFAEIIRKYKERLKEMEGK